MKITHFKQQLGGCTINQLDEKLDELRRELFTLKLKKVSAPTKDVSEFNKIRKNIARILTVRARMQQDNVGKKNSERGL
jgi:ribosomal protein L29